MKIFGIGLLLNLLPLITSSWAGVKILTVDSGELTLSLEAAQQSETLNKMMSDTESGHPIPLTCEICTHANLKEAFDWIQKDLNRETKISHFFTPIHFENFLKKIMLLRLSNYLDVPKLFIDSATTLVEMISRPTFLKTPEDLENFYTALSGLPPDLVREIEKRLRGENQITLFKLFKPLLAPKKSTIYERHSKAQSCSVSPNGELVALSFDRTPSKIVSERTQTLSSSYSEIVFVSDTEAIAYKVASDQVNFSKLTLESGSFKEVDFGSLPLQSDRPRRCCNPSSYALMNDGNFIRNQPFDWGENTLEIFETENKRILFEKKFEIMMNHYALVNYSPYENKLWIGLTDLDNATYYTVDLKSKNITSQIRLREPNGSMIYRSMPYEFLPNAPDTVLVLDSVLKLPSGSEYSLRVLRVKNLKTGDFAEITQMGSDSMKYARFSRNGMYLCFLEGNSEVKHLTIQPMLPYPFTLKQLAFILQIKSSPAVLKSKIGHSIWKTLPEQVRSHLKKSL